MKIKTILTRGHNVVEDPWLNTAGEGGDKLMEEDLKKQLHIISKCLLGDNKFRAKALMK